MIIFFFGGGVGVGGAGKVISGGYLLWDTMISSSETTYLGAEILT
jgi:hypothetical protein